MCTTVFSNALVSPSCPQLSKSPCRGILKADYIQTEQVAYLLGSNSLEETLHYPLAKLRSVAKQPQNHFLPGRQGVSDEMTCIAMIGGRRQETRSFRQEKSACTRFCYTYQVAGLVG